MRFYLRHGSAKFNEPADVFTVPCDLVFPCSTLNRLEEANVGALATNGCIAVIEGVQQGASYAAVVAARKRGLMHGPYRATTVGASLFNGLTIAE